MKHTPTPWEQGRLLDTPQTKRWPEEQIKAAQTDEELSIFANFSPMDNGRSRSLVARAYSKEDAARIVACVNAFEGIEDPAEYMALAKNLLQKGYIARTEADGLREEIIQWRQERDALRHQVQQLESLTSEIINEGHFENARGLNGENKVAFRTRLNAILGIGAGGGA